MSADILDTLLGSLGIPKRVLSGEQASASFYRELDHLYDKAITVQTREYFSRKVLEPALRLIIVPLMEKAFPECYWEPLYLCSPRGRMMIRKAVPTLPKVVYQLHDEIVLGE